MRHSPAPRYGEGHEQCVETRIVESFPDVLAGGEEDALLIVRNARQPLRNGFGLLPPHAASKHDQVADTPGELSGERVQVPIALRQHERRTGLAHGPDHIFANQAIAPLVLHQFPG